MKKIDNNEISRYIAIAGIAILGGFLVLSLSKFFNAALGAVILYILFKPLMTFLNKKMKLGKSASAFLVILGSCLLILLPLTGISYLLASKINILLSDTNKITSNLKLIEQFVVQNLHINLFSEANMESIKNMLTQLFSLFLSQSISIIGNIAIMYFILYYMLTSAGYLEEKINSYSPYNKENTRLFKKELEAHTFSNALISPLLAVMQGIAAIVGFWIFGLEEPVFWGMMCGVFSLLPFVGSALVWAPAGIIHLANGNQWQGIAIILYGTLVISNIDNVFRFTLQKKFADIHPLITVLGVIIGLEWFGLPGLIFGPLTISVFILMFKAYRNEYFILQGEH